LFAGRRHAIVTFASRRGVLSALVVCEIALALMLLISAGLLVEAFQKVLHVEPVSARERADLPDFTSNAKYAKPEQWSHLLAIWCGRCRPCPASNPRCRIRAALEVTGQLLPRRSGRELGPKEQDPVVLQVVATRDILTPSA